MASGGFSCIALCARPDSQPGAARRCTSRVGRRCAQRAPWASEQALCMGWGHLGVGWGIRLEMRHCRGGAPAGAGEPQPRSLPPWWPLSAWPKLPWG